MREDLDLKAGLNRSTVVPVGAGVGKKGRGAGFYCEACDLTFKDSIQYVDHLNSRAHLANAGQSSQVEKATLSQVRERIETLAKQKNKTYNVKEAAEAAKMKLGK